MQSRPAAAFPFRPAVRLLVVMWSCFLGFTSSWSIAHNGRVAQAASPVRDSQNRNAPPADRTGVIAAKFSSLLDHPSLEAQVAARLPRGTEVKVVGSTDGWMKVALTGGGEGWIPEVEIALKVNRNGGVCLEMGLKEALDVGALDGSFHGTGRYAGDSVELTATAKLKATICPKFKPGLELQNAESGSQNMVLKAPKVSRRGGMILDMELRFDPEVEVTYVFEAYCLNFEKATPDGLDELAPKGDSREEIRRILSVESENIYAIQLAIWAVTDDPSRKEFYLTSDDLEEAARILKAAGLSPRSFRLFSTE